MKYLLISCLFLTWFFDGFNDIAKTNDLKKQAQTAYTAGNFEDAIGYYSELIDSMGIAAPNLRMNMASACFTTKDTTRAKSLYHGLIQENDPAIQTQAHQQLGVMAAQEKQYEKAAQSFKEALRADPANEEARYNYELAKELLKEQQKQQKQDKNQQKDQKKQQNQDQKQQKQNKDQKGDQQNQDQQQQQKGDQKDQQQQDSQQKQQNQDKKGEQQQQQAQEGQKDDKKDQQGRPQSQRLENMNMSEDQARMILDAMRNNEIQYIQQNRRKATERPDRSKPDW